MKKQRARPSPLGLQAANTALTLGEEALQDGRDCYALLRSETTADITILRPCSRPLVVVVVHLIAWYPLFTISSCRLFLCLPLPLPFLLCLVKLK